MNRIQHAKNLLSLKEEGFSIKCSLMKSWKRLYFRLVVLAVAICLYFIAVENVAFLLVIGILLGATLQDIGWIWRIGKNWKFTEEVIDWGKVEDVANNS